MNPLPNQPTDRPELDKAFRSKAHLVIVKPNYAYIEIGNERYYFLGTPVHEKVTLMSGEEVTETILPYDGWEKTL